MSVAEEKVRTLSTTLPSIEDVYAAIAREHPVFSKKMPTLPGGSIERRAFCLNPQHVDMNPSCSYNTDTNVYKCLACNTGGNSVQLVISAGVATDIRTARAWLRQHGLLKDADTATASWWARVDVTYDYVTLDRKLSYQKGRTNNPKEFRQRTPDGVNADGSTKWKNTVKGLTSIPYKWPELAQACADGKVVFVPEGEKDVDNLCKHGFVATTNCEGASSPWPLEWAEYFVGASRVVVLSDNDEPGRKAARQKASVIARSVPDTRIIFALPGVADKGDISDWFELGGTKEELLALVDQAEQVEAYIPPYKPEALQRLLDDMTDVGNGDWFIDVVGDRVRYVKNYKDWFVWDGMRWTGNESVQHAARVALDTMKAAAADLRGEKSEELLEHATATRTANKIRNMLELAEHHRMITADDFDAQTYLLNCTNGTLDLRTFELRPAAQADHLTKVTRVPYDPTATCPNFEALLYQCMDGDDALIDYFVQLAGGALEGRIGTRRLYFLHGPAGTGKSTVVKALEAAMGEYACSVDMSALCETRNRDSSAPSPELVRLKGMRLVTAAEASSAHRLDDAKIKQLVGGDTIVARALHQDPIEFKFMATLLLFGNDDPNVQADESFWSKLKKIPFMHRIGKSDEGYFDRCIVPELPGILALMVRGLQKYKGNGYQLEDPTAVLEATELYRSSANPLSDFVDECCVIDDAAKTPVSALKSSYHAWVQRTGGNAKYAMGDKKFASYMRQIGASPVKFNNIRCWSGIRLSIEEVNRATQRSSYETHSTDDTEDVNF